MLFTDPMDSANLDEKKVAELINEKMKELQISRREKIFPYPVEEIKFLEILKSKLYIPLAYFDILKLHIVITITLPLGIYECTWRSLMEGNVLSYFVYVTA